MVGLGFLLLKINKLILKIFSEQIFASIKPEGILPCKAGLLVQCALHSEKHTTNSLYQTVFDKWNSNIWHYLVIYPF